MDRPNCGTCLYWCRTPGGDGDRGMPGGAGECRHGPPQLVATAAGGLGHPHASAWPPVHSGQYCGQHPSFAAWVTWRATQQSH